MENSLISHPNVHKRLGYRAEAIAEKFSKSAPFYDKFAKVQKFAAHRLYENIIHNVNYKKPMNILEIGCGTGILSRHLVKAFPGSIIEFLDPAVGMLRTCENNLYECRPNISQPYIFIEKSIEDYINDDRFCANKYSLITSSFSLHWVENLPFIVNKLIESLEIGGQFFFSYPTNKSFPEWKSICQQLKLPFTGNELPGAEQLKLAVEPKRASIKWQECAVKLEFENALEFFKEIKHLGADTPMRRQLNQTLIASQLSVSEFRCLIRGWNQMGNAPIKSKETSDTYNKIVHCTYWIIEGIITRHN